MIVIAQLKNQTETFKKRDEFRTSQYASMLKEISKTKNADLIYLFDNGFGMHNAGMSRKERNLMESAFTKGFITVLCSTATLAWGVNLPAHHVVIKGTDIYTDGKTKDLGVLDIQQIFGRAGRPQFDTSGDATLITSLSKLEN